MFISIYHSFIVILNLLVMISLTRQHYIGCVLNDGCDEEINNCSNSNAPKPLTMDRARELQKICPSLFPSNSSDINKVPVCCSAFGAVRLKVFSNYFEEKFQNILCWLNIRELFCQLICSPYQSNFVKPKEKITPFRSNKRKIFKPTVKYYLNEDYSHEIFESCRTMNYSIKAVHQSVCSSDGSPRAKCKWFEGLEYRIPSIMDYQLEIEFKFDVLGLSKNSYRDPLNETIHHCDERINTGMKLCHGIRNQSNSLHEMNFLTEEKYFSYVAEFVVSISAILVICLVLITLFVFKIQFMSCNSD